MKPVRLAKRAVTDPNALHDIVEACRTVRLGTTDDEGMFIVPMSFGYDWELDNDGTPRLTLWLHSAGEGRKAAAFLVGGEGGVPVAIEMDCEDGLITGNFACAYSFAYRSIMGWGRIFPVTARDEKADGLARIMEHLAPGAPCEFSEAALDRVAVWRVEVERFTGKQRA
ncbi:pyridoxamine 5'-phosphate oxidase family protein [uncultured Enorma sp.]|uniref:pyridoxamine 5'-phosphate oxidase family protein n=1 Tax=uncultured Enorma sp. TaxID=1714346 RepID=UPI00262B835D|nr:pyridoxamine 5'-phosphate oxidase family protein [uncultured Enorma sp.]